MRRVLQLSILGICLAPAARAREFTLYATDFTTLDGWTAVSGCEGGSSFAWNADATPASHPGGPYVSAPASLNFNNGTHIGNVDSFGGPTTCGWITSPAIDLSVASGTPRLRFLASWDCESGCEWDILSLAVRSVATDEVLLSQCLNPSPSNGWNEFEFDLDGSWGEVEIEFVFDTVDGWENTGSGPFVDDLEVVFHAPVSFSVVCPGDGSGTACPCDNEGAADEGCANSTGAGARLVASGSASIELGDLVLSATQLRANQFGTYLQGNVSLNGGDGIVFGDGLRCAGSGIVRLQQVMSGGSGQSATSIDLAERGGVLPGDTRTYQLWYRDPVLSPCGSNFNLTNGIELSWLP